MTRGYEEVIMGKQVSPTILDHIPFKIDEPELLQRLHADESSVFLEDIRCFVRDAETCARPKGLYTLAAVNPADDASIMLDGFMFRSRVLRVNLEGVYRAFPFIATCGTELEAWSRTLRDPLLQFWADAVKEMALAVALRAVGDHCAAAYQPGALATMNPGSLQDWPVSEQRPLFSLFGGAADAIGVALTDSFLMSPVKSVSGVWFETDKGFVNCQLCSREDCPNRRAPHDPHLFSRQYQ